MIVENIMDLHVVNDKNGFITDLKWITPYQKAPQFV